MPFDPANNPLNNQEWIFPTLEVFHISCFAMSVGLISAVNLRLSGAALARYPAAELDRKLFLWTLAGLTVVITAGMLLFTTDPLRYYYNNAFRFKMLALLVALVYHYTVHRRIIRTSNEGSAVAVASSLLSTVLWVSVTFGGIFYAFAD